MGQNWDRILWIRGGTMATPLLKQGSRGEAVRELQQFLKDQGYYKGNVDAIFGPQTAAAVKAFQQAQGLKVDAIVGPQTWGAINAIKGMQTVAAPQSTQQATPKPTTSTTQATAIAQTNPVTQATQSTAPTTTVPQNVPIGYITYTPLSEEEIRRQAEEKVLPLYNAQVEALKQAAERQKQALQQQQEYLQYLYNLRRQDLQELYDQERQRASNEALKRGLARSTYAVDVQSRIGELETKALQQLQQDLTLQVGQLQSQITTLEQQLADSLRRLDIDRATQISSMIDQLRKEQEEKLLQIQQYNNELATRERQEQLQREQFDWEKQFRQQQFDWQKALQEWEKQFKQQQFDWQKHIDQQQLALAKSRAASSSSKNVNVNPFALAVQDILNSSDPLKTFREKYPQYASVLTLPELQELEATARARDAQLKNMTSTLKTSSGGGGKPQITYSLN